MGRSSIIKISLSWVRPVKKIHSFFLVDWHSFDPGFNQKSDEQNYAIGTALVCFLNSQRELFSYHRFPSRSTILISMVQFYVEFSVFCLWIPIFLFPAINRKISLCQLCFFPVKTTSIVFHLFLPPVFCTNM